MEKDTDYYVKMLRVYFRDNNMSKKNIDKLLESNPFDNKFIKWEKNYTKANRLLANSIKQHNLINFEKNSIDELTSVDDESISKYLLFNISQNIRLPKITLVHDNLLGKSYLPDLIKNNKHFIIGISTKNYTDYKARLEYYEKNLKNNKNYEIIESYTDGNNTCIIRK